MDSKKDISKYFSDESSELEKQAEMQQVQQAEAPVEQETKMRPILDAKDLEHYANSDCSKCFGRGHKGKITEPGGRIAWLTCKCAEKNYRKLKEILKEQ